MLKLTNPDRDDMQNSLIESVLYDFINQAEMAKPDRALRPSETFAHRRAWARLGGRGLDD